MSCSFEIQFPTWSPAPRCNPRDTFTSVSIYSKWESNIIVVRSSIGLESSLKPSFYLPKCSQEITSTSTTTITMARASVELEQTLPGIWLLKAIISRLEDDYTSRHTNGPFRVPQENLATWRGLARLKCARELLFNEVLIKPLEPRWWLVDGNGWMGDKYSLFW